MGLSQGRRQAPPRLCMYPCMTNRRGPLSYVTKRWVAAALALVVVLLRIDPPVSVKRWWFCISRASIASAIVVLLIHSYQCSIGSWLVMMVARMLARSSMISSKSARVEASMAVMPQSSSSNTSVFLSVSSHRVKVPLAWRMRSSSPRRGTRW